VEASRSLVGTIERLRQLLPHLDDAIVIALDLSREPIDWTTTSARSSIFLGCKLTPDGSANVLHAGGALLDDLPGRRPFRTFRADLYSRSELAGRTEDPSQGSLDERIAGYYRGTVVNGSPPFADGLVQGIHDACIDNAVDRFRKSGTNEPRRIVGIMSSHETSRADPMYEEIVRAAFRLTRAGYCVATGGGLGIMEAGNLGAWLAFTADEDRIGHAIRILRRAPEWTSDGREAFLDAATAVIERYPEGAESLGMATWGVPG